MHLPDFGAVHVLVYGDVMLDRTVSGSTVRVSPEAPVPVVAWQRESTSAGGAANVASGIAALGARCTLLGIVGNDADGALLEDLCRTAGVNTHFERTSESVTISKTRVISRGQQLLRVDREQPLPAAAAAALAVRLERLLDDVHVLLISDYDKGSVVQPALLIAAARARGLPVVVDPKLKPLSCWRGATLVKPNRSEFAAVAGAPLDGRVAPLQVAQLAREQLRIHGIEYLLVTLGSEGMALAAEDGVHHIAAEDVDVFDVTGAGDTVAAVLATAMAAGMPPAQAARLASAAAALAVGQVGTVAVTHARLAERLQRPRRAGGALLSLEQLLAQVQAARQRGERLVFTNGCFDLLHAGHVGYLQQAAACGDRLIVALNDDASVTRLKGAGRPLNTLADRAAVLAALAAVDWVVSFAEDTPHRLLEQLRPDVLVKGGDYSLDGVIGAELVRSWNGEVRVLDHIDSPSTSDLISRGR